MAYEEGITYNRLTAPAAADLSAKQYRAITVGPTGMDVSTAAKDCDGILQDNPTSGQAGCYAYDGVTKAAISASSTVTGGTTLLEVDTGGTLKPVSAGTPIAKALESVVSNAGIVVIAVKLLRSNAVFV